MGEDRGHSVLLGSEIRLNCSIYVIHRSRGHLLLYQNAHFMHSLVDSDALIVFEISRWNLCSEHLVELLRDLPFISGLTRWKKIAQRKFEPAHM